MSLKIIAIPLLVLSIMIFSRWFLYPEYNEMQAVSESVTAEKARNEKYEKTNSVITKLISDLEREKGNMDILGEYIPAEKMEEYIISDLNDVSFTSGLSVLEISFEEEKKSSLPAVDSLGNPVPLDPTTGEPAVIDPQTGAIVISPAPKEKSVNVRFIAIGEYAQIRSMLRKMESMKRYNEMGSVKISKEVKSQDDSAKEDEAAARLLRIEATIRFNYLEGVKTIDSLDNKILGSDKLDFSAVEKIEREKSTDTPSINILSAGRDNPFVLLEN